jgi:hypothetical protein
MAFRCALCGFFAFVALKYLELAAFPYSLKLYRNERKEPAAAGATK